MSNEHRIALTVPAEPELARLVRMTASNAALLSSMSVERVEDIRMAAEEAFIFACSARAGEPVQIAFAVDPEQVALELALGCDEFPEPDPDDPTADYADLILGSVCDSYTKLEHPAALELVLKADVA